ncbi:WW domain-binding protein 4-like [Ptychodera flava]|uniref:WW domain-binding protein 4-like n=1 Tax=Ptychodera flava TaxID=63121 RepID=UPI00396AAFFC
MADYWKSQPKKFCDFCKCWITDNKASVDFHERGKRHKENVQKRITDIQKKGIAKEKKDAAFKSDLQAMEEAALKAFEKDAARDPSLAAQYQNAVQRKKAQDARQTEEQNSRAPSQLKPEDILPYWVEGVSPEGYTYYWNSFTNESTWEKPEGFVSTVQNDATEQQAPDQSSEQNTENTSSETQGDSQPPEEQTGDQVSEEQSENQAVEQSIDGAEGVSDEGADEAKEANDDKNASDGAEEKNDKPTNSSTKKRSNPYGNWESVQPASTETPDLQLPESRPIVSAPVTLSTSEPKIKIKFKEKTVGTIGGSSEGVSVGFKKRKIGNRNIKKREEES